MQGTLVLEQNSLLRLLKDGLTKVMRSFLIAIPIVSGTAFIISSIFGYKLYLEFGWSIYKHVGADLRLKRRYLAYLVSILYVHGQYL